MSETNLKPQSALAFSFLVVFIPALIIYCLAYIVIDKLRVFF